MNDQDQRRCVSTDIQTRIAGLLPSGVVQLGLRIVSPGHSHLPEIPGVMNVLDPCARWPSVTGAMQLIVEAGEQRAIGVVHADGDMQIAVRSARQIVACLGEAIHRCKSEERLVL